MSIQFDGEAVMKRRAREDNLKKLILQNILPGDER